VLTRDMNGFDTPERFDRVVSVEMFEHLRNWPRAFAHVARWLAPGGRFFLHVFAHRGAPYPFVERDASDWMSRHFFSGGQMPSDDLALRFQDELRLLSRWRWDGTHYQRTAEAWLANMDRQQAALMPLFATIYGADAAVWWMRWRLFFMSVAELFGHAGGPAVVGQPLPVRKARLTAPLRSPSTRSPRSRRSRWRRGSSASSARREPGRPHVAGLHRRRGDRLLAVGARRRVSAPT
jgi:SAM-dependent methyltransferase